MLNTEAIKLLWLNQLWSWTCLHKLPQNDWQDATALDIELEFAKDFCTRILLVMLIWSIYFLNGFPREMTRFNSKVACPLKFFVYAFRSMLSSRYGLKWANRIQLLFPPPHKCGKVHWRYGSVAGAPEKQEGSWYYFNIWSYVRTFNSIHVHWGWNLLSFTGTSPKCLSWWKRMGGGLG